MARRFRRRGPKPRWMQTFGTIPTQLDITLDGQSSIETSNILERDDLTSTNNTVNVGPALDQFSTIVIKRIVGFWHASLDIGQRTASGETYAPGNFSVCRWDWGIFVSQVDTSAGFGAALDLWDPAMDDKQRWRWLVRRHHLFANPFAIPIDENAFDFPSNTGLTFGQNQGPFFDWKGTAVIPYGHRLWIAQSAAVEWTIASPTPGTISQIWGMRNIRVLGYVRQGGFTR